MQDYYNTQLNYRPAERLERRPADGKPGHNSVKCPTTSALALFLLGCCVRRWQNVDWHGVLPEGLKDDYLAGPLKRDFQKMVIDPIKIAMPKSDESEEEEEEEALVDGDAYARKGDMPKSVVTAFAATSAAAAAAAAAAASVAAAKAAEAAEAAAAAFGRELGRSEAAHSTHLLSSEAELADDEEAGGSSHKGKKKKTATATAMKTVAASFAAATAAAKKIVKAASEAAKAAKASAASGDDSW